WYRLPIGAGAERAAGAREHPARSVVVGVKGAEGIVQLSRGGGVDGIPAMRPIDGNDGEGSIAFDKNRIGIGHVRAPSLFVGRHCEERSDEAIQTVAAETFWIASLRSQ